MTNEKRNIQFCKNTLEPAPAPGKNREAFFLSLTFFRGVGNIHLLLDNRSYSCLLMAGRLIEREEFLTRLTRRNYLLDCDLCRVLSVLRLPGEAIIKLESVMGRETMGPVRDVRRSLVNSISRWQWGRVTWRFMDNSDNHISSRPTIHQWL